MDQQRRLDARHIFRFRSAAVIGDCGRKIRQHHRHGIDHGAAEAEAHGANLAILIRVCPQIFIGGDEVHKQLAGVKLGLHVTALVVVSGIAAQRSQPVRGERREACDGEAARHVLDIGIEPPVLMHHDNGATLAAHRRLHEKPLRGPIALGRLEGDSHALYAGIIGLDLFGQRIIRQ